MSGDSTPEDERHIEVAALVDRIRARRVAYDAARHYGIRLDLDHVDMSRMERMAELLVELNAEVVRREDSDTARPVSDDDVRRVKQMARIMAERDALAARLRTLLDGIEAARLHDVVHRLRWELADTTADRLATLMTVAAAAAVPSGDEEPTE